MTETEEKNRPSSGSGVFGLGKLMGLRRQCKKCKHAPGYHYRSKCTECRKKCEYEEEIVDKNTGKPPKDLDYSIAKKIEKHQKKKEKAKGASKKK